MIAPLLFAVAAAALPAPPPGMHVGYAVMELKSGTILNTFNEDQFFAPASNNKLYTTAFALETLGSEYKFTTELHFDGHNLRLVGAGDPNLSSRIVPYKVDAPDGDPLAALRDFVASLKAAGVRQIDGDVIGVSGGFKDERYPDGWTVDDTLYEYGAPVSALMLEDNTVHIRITPTAPNELASIRMEPKASDLLVINQVITGTQTNLEMRRPGQGEELIISGTIASDEKQLTADAAVYDPARSAAMNFRDLVEDSGVSVRGGARGEYCASCPPASDRLLASKQSAPLSQIVQVVNKVSQNLHAEVLFREASRTGDRDKFLAQFGATLDASDGSGLARNDLANPVSTVKLLQHMWNGPQHDVWLASLPIGGVDGTLQSRFKNMDWASRVHAKTGSYVHTRALSGYVESKSRGWLAFSVLVDDTVAPTADIYSFMDAFCAALSN